MLPDPFDWVGIFDSKIASTSGAQQRLILERLKARLLAEMARDLEGVLARLAPDFSLTTFPRGVGDTTTGHAGVSAMLERIWTSDGTSWMEVRHLLCDGAAVLAEGFLHYVGQGRELERSFGHKLAGSSGYHFSTRFAMLSTFADGLMQDEITYFDTAGSKVAIEPEVLDAFRRSLESRASQLGLTQGPLA